MCVSSKTLKQKIPYMKKKQYRLLYHRYIDENLMLNYIMNESLKKKTFVCLLISRG